MATAPRTDQLQLLEVAQLDAQLSRLRRDDERHPLRTEIGELMNLVAAKSRDISQTEQDLATAEKALRSASAKTADMAAAISEKEHRLQSGTGMDSRQLLTLQSEIATQREMLDELTEAEFAALEKTEALETQLAELGAQRDVLNERIVTGRSELEDASAQIQGEIAQLQTERAALYLPLAESLRREYERAQASGGLAVIAVHPNGETSGGMQLSPIEVAAIKNADPDQINISDEYNCIVVLLDA
ncbi:MAG: hypothetical protein Q4E03_03760 [Trueperella sp.]|nr:hypothetical protein [Trueperella sp.]